MVMLFGLMNAPAPFKRIMDGILRETQFTSTYSDDVVVFSKTTIEHTEHLQSIFDNIRKHDLRLKITICKLSMSEVNFVGHIVGADGIEVKSEKISVIKNALTYKTLLRSEVS